MENKKTKLTISGTAKKSIKNIEIAKTQGKNSVVIEKSNKNFTCNGNDIFILCNYPYLSLHNRLYGQHSHLVAGLAQDQFRNHTHPQPLLDHG